MHTVNWSTVLLDKSERFLGRDEKVSVKGPAIKQFGRELGPLFYDLWIQLVDLENTYRALC